MPTWCVYSSRIDGSDVVHFEVEVATLCTKTIFTLAPGGYSSVYIGAPQMIVFKLQMRSRIVLVMRARHGRPGLARVTRIRECGCPSTTMRRE